MVPSDLEVGGTCDCRECGTALPAGSTVWEVEQRCGARIDGWNKGMGVWGHVCLRTQKTCCSSS